MTENHRVLNKNGKTILVDWDGNRVNPDVAQEVAQNLLATASQKSYVYFATKSGNNKEYKIGFTSDLERRTKELRKEYGESLTIQHSIECDAYGDRAAPALEAALHKFFDEFDMRTSGEWYLLTGLCIHWIQVHKTSTSMFIQLSVLKDLTQEITKAISASENLEQAVKVLVSAAIKEEYVGPTLIALDLLLYLIVKTNRSEAIEMAYEILQTRIFPGHLTQAITFLDRMEELAQPMLDYWEEERLKERNEQFQKAQEKGNSGGFGSPPQSSSLQKRLEILRQKRQQTR